MRVLRLISSVNPAHGGPIEGLKQSAQASRTHGVATEVVSLDDPREPYVAEFPEPLHALGPGFANYGYTPKLVPWLRAHAAGFDAVIVDGLWQFPTLAVWRALRGSTVPYYVFPHGMLDPWFNRTYRAKHAKKWLYWQAVEGRVVRDAAAVLFTCEEERELARRSFRPYRAREEVVGYGTNAPPGDPELQLATLLREFPALRDKRIVLFLSRLHPKKGCDDLLSAFAKVAARDSRLQLVMAGPDSVGWQRELAARAVQAGIGDRITWTGMLLGDAKWGAYRAAEVLALPSHQENFGIVIAEALACRVPVLISDKVNIWREVAAAGAGLVGGDNERETERLLVDWLSLPDEAKERMRQRASDCFQRHFDLSSVATNFHKLLARQRRPAAAPDARAYASS